MEDLDFDGWADLRGVSDFGAKWGTHKVWLFDQHQGKFVSTRLAREIEKLINLTVDRERQELLAYTIGPSQPSRDTYKVEGGKLIAIEHCLFDHDQVRRGTLGELIVQRRVNGKMLIVERKQISTQADPYLNPCQIPDRITP